MTPQQAAMLPASLFVAYAQLLPRLRAERTMSDVNVIAFPHLQDSARKRFINRLEVMAGFKKSSGELDYEFMHHLKRYTGQEIIYTPDQEKKLDDLRAVARKAGLIK